VGEEAERQSDGASEGFEGGHGGGGASARGGGEDRGNGEGGEGGGGVSLDDFSSYMPSHNYIFMPNRESWPASSVNARIPRQPLLNADGSQALDDKGSPK
jgi:hypothetical protein